MSSNNNNNNNNNYVISPPPSVAGIEDLRFINKSNHTYTWKGTVNQQGSNIHEHKKNTHQNSSNMSSTQLKQKFNN